jgi:hypothetical protein
LHRSFGQRLLLVLVTIAVVLCAACGKQPGQAQAPEPSRPRTVARSEGCASKLAPPCAVAGAATHGTGILAHTRFVKAPIIVYFKAQKPDPHFAGYTIYLPGRLKPEVPSRGIEEHPPPERRTPPSWAACAYPIDGSDGGQSLGFQHLGIAVRP